MARRDDGSEPVVRVTEPKRRKSDDLEDEAERVKHLPSLLDRIDAMGLSEEYAAYRERYLRWRQGEHQGARGDITAVDLKRRASEFFGYWYPSMEIWQWRRSLSYWIAVTFFEGSLFFMISSFMFCYADKLGNLKMALTTWGYVAGKFNFIICTYLMCIETINLTAGKHKGGSPSRQTTRQQRSLSLLSLRTQASVSSTDSESSSSSDADEKKEPFYFWPFHYRKALRNLEELGAGPWPYYASVIYFLGVGLFTVGLVAEFIPGLPEELVKWTLLISFLLGSIFFLLGGLAECVENEVFTSLSMDQGWWGAVLNTLGSAGFVIGAVLGFFPGFEYSASFCYGVGSAIFAVGSAVMIVMWKDEQFGLTFLAVLNNLDEGGRPKVPGQDEIQATETLSFYGTIFIMVYCLAGCLSVYNFTISIHNVFHLQESLGTLRIIQTSFNALLPCIFAHMLLVVNSSVLRTPRHAPFHQLYIATRWLSIAMVINSGGRVVEAILEVNNPFVSCTLVHSG
ncbi:unnamed protein product [Polarella glacialis]|uniref:Uncharacterized protein n=1 Tax=Polarella glacialis TaxID=89957 RepID=A0A813D8R4_POLGL|nr:unnamed protein product [Polarella glacialis]CAE8673240.1 unnamed protein product [Polarella glacialis]